MNGSSLLSGRLEVCAFRIWGTVCDDQFNSNAAMVACRQLGFGKYILSSGIPPLNNIHPLHNKILSHLLQLGVLLFPVAHIQLVLMGSLSGLTM